MNLFKGLLFLHGHLTDPSVLEPTPAAGYGNKAAAEQRFRDHFAQPTYARSAVSAPAPELCPAGGCG